MRIIFSDNGMKMLLNFRGPIIRHFVEQGAEVLLVYPRCTHDVELEANIPRGCRTIWVDINPTGNNPLEDLKYTGRLYKIYKQEQPDIVFHYTIKPNIYGTLAAWFAGVPKRISMVTGLGYAFSGNGMTKRIARLLYKLGLRLSTRVITLNASNRNLLVEKGYVKDTNCLLFKCGEGVDLKQFPYKENKFDTVHFLMVARVLYDKGYAEFVEAAKIVKQLYPSISFELLGPIDDKSPMRVSREVIESDVASGAIDYLGVTNDVPSVVGRNGVVVVLVSSYHEGLNRSLMEACAMGRPVITSNIPGCQELIGANKNGFLVPPKDAQALADAMCKFIKLSESDKQIMAYASYEHAKHTFDIKLVIDAYDRMLASLDR